MTAYLVNCGPYQRKSVASGYGVNLGIDQGQTLPAAPPYPPTITDHTDDIIIAVGSPLTLTVTVTGETPFSYQWYLGTTPVGIDSATYSKTLALEDYGVYTCVITNVAGTATSDDIRVRAFPTGQYQINVGPNQRKSNASGYGISQGIDQTQSLPVAPAYPPTITDHTDDTIIAVGDTLLLSVTVSGTAPFFYQWYLGTTPVGIDSATYSKTLALEDYGVYTCVITNVAGSETSDDIRVRAFPIEKYGVNPGPNQWDNSNVGYGVNVGVYQTTSEIPPVIIDQSSDDCLTRGDTLGIFVSATGTTLEYQWYQNDILIPDATDSTYIKPLAVGDDCGSYICKVHNSAGEVETTPIIITMFPIILSQSFDSVVIRGESLVVFVIADGSAPISYQWYQDGNMILDATEATYTKLEATGRTCGVYTCEVTNNT